MFAVAATLLNLSGSYSASRYTDTDQGFFTKDYVDDVEAIAAQWRLSGGAEKDGLQPLWDLLTACQGEPLAGGAGTWWLDAAVKLVSIADAASLRMGFLPDQEPLAALVFRELLDNLHPSNAQQQRLPYLPESICIWVPKSEAAVLPKSATPELGCTLRSFSHHLCLLPPVGEVHASWRCTALQQGSEPLNLLLIPYPYKVDGTCFTPTLARAALGTGARFFSVEPQWLPCQGPDVTVAFIRSLIAAAKCEVGRVNGVVIPEGAMTASHAQDIARSLQGEGLELFIAGAATKPQDGSIGQNGVYVSLYDGGTLLVDWVQLKHHRWRLDRDQIRRYSLGHSLDPSKLWWEHIDISERCCNFWVFRDGAVLAALVCEDLARIDPVQSVIRSVGPNLVIALLMDGPQEERRWPGRYATVLADDPGCSVLTLTSLGMPRRGARQGHTGAHVVALWKDPYGKAEELILPRGKHAIVVTLCSRSVEGVTFDGRSDRHRNPDDELDGGNTVRLALSGVHAVSVAHPEDFSGFGLEDW